MLCLLWISCVCILPLSWSAFFPCFKVYYRSHPSQPPRKTGQICKNTLLISRQIWQCLPTTSAPDIRFFSFFISCSAPETQTLAICPPSVLQTQPHWHTVYMHSYRKDSISYLVVLFLWICRKEAKKRKQKYTLSYFSCNAIWQTHSEIETSRSSCLQKTTTTSPFS